jgi:hypothetical protein
MKKRFITLCLLVTAAAFGQEKEAAGAIDAASYIELLRSDVKAQKVKLMTEGMNLSDEDAAVFWPVYRKYQYELDALNDELLEALKDYARNYENLTSQKATELAKKSFELQERKLKLRKTYFEECNKVLPPKMAARYAQLDNRINLLLDLQLASRVPLVK